MSDTWDERRRAMEEQYFQNKNKEALSRIKARETQKKRLSPITGEPMEELTVMGVIIDRCPKSGGIWLDAGELEQIIKTSKEAEGGENWLTNFFGNLFQSKS